MPQICCGQKKMKKAVITAGDVKFFVIHESPDRSVKISFLGFLNALENK
jgi:uncharacterized protein with GYD domain